MIYIIKHGQIDWNIEHRTQGQTDIDNGDNFNEKKYLDEYMPIKINNLDVFIIDEEMNFKKYDSEK